MFRRSLVNISRYSALTRTRAIRPLPLLTNPSHFNQFKFSHQYRSLFIQTEETPNDNALKFLPSQSFLPEGETIEFLSGREAHASPLARKLFAIDGVKSIMFGSNFITIQKSNDYSWMIIKPEIFAILTEVFTSGEPIFDDDFNLNDSQSTGNLPKDVEFDEDDDDVVSMIKELIFTRIRPAIQEDGGDIEFIKFDEENGAVYLRLKGACRSCDSSSVTLKNGIESMLKHYIEEVEEVKQLEEDEEEVEEDPLLSIKNKRMERLASSAPPPSL